MVNEVIYHSSLNLLLSLTSLDIYVRIGRIGCDHCDVLGNALNRDVYPETVEFNS